MGVRPDLTSRGLASALLDQVDRLARTLFAPRTLRAVVATANSRSLALCARAGLTAVREFPGPGGRRYRELTREIDPV